MSSRYRYAVNQLFQYPEAEGFAIAGEAGNGIEALEILRHTPVDLVIADIQMPGMGGLQLLEKIREMGMDNVNFVILSGFREFNYAQKAMQYGCLNYFIKPISKSDLLGIVRGVAEQSKQRRIAEEKEEVRDSAMLECNLLPILVGKYDQINIDYVREKLNLSAKIRYISVELDMSDARIQIRTEEHLRSMQRMLYASMRSNLGERADHVLFDVCKEENCYDVGMIFCDTMAEERGMGEQQFFDWLVERAEISVENSIVMQVGSEVDKIERLHESYRSANIAKLMQSFQGGGALYVADGGSQMQDELSGETYSRAKVLLDALVSAVESGNRQEIESAVDAFYRHMGESAMVVSRSASLGLR